MWSRRSDVPRTLRLILVGAINAPLAPVHTAVPHSPAPVAAQVLSSSPCTPTIPSPDITTCNASSRLYYSGLIYEGAPRYRTVSASWTVVTPACPPFAALQPQPVGPVNQWVGLGALHDAVHPTNLTLAQIGTSVECLFLGLDVAFAWTELANQEVEIRGLLVFPGDTIQASVTQDPSTGELTLDLVDKSSHLLFGPAELKRTVTPDDFRHITHRKAIDFVPTDADCILERPTDFFTGQLRPIPNFGIAHFDDCTVGGTKKDGATPAVSNTIDVYTMTDSTGTTMAAPTGVPPISTLPVQTTDRSQETSFMIKWQNEGITDR